MRTSFKHRGALWAACAAVFAGVAVAPAAHAAAAGVAVVRSGVWMPGDAVQEGAGEFEVMMSVARVQKEFSEVGIVGVGNRHGLFVKGAEHALRFFALRGVPVAKVCTGGDLVADPDGLFIDSGRLSEKEASMVLQRCLQRYGQPPAATDPEHPTQREIAAIRDHLVPFRQAFAVASAKGLAMR